MEISAVLPPASWGFVIATWLHYHLQASTTQLEGLPHLGSPPAFIIYLPSFFYQAHLFAAPAPCFLWTDSFQISNPSLTTFSLLVWFLLHLYPTSVFPAVLCRQLLVQYWCSYLAEVNLAYQGSLPVLQFMYFMYILCLVDRIIILKPWLPYLARTKHEQLLIIQAKNLRNSSRVTSSILTQSFTLKKS